MDSVATMAHAQNTRLQLLDAGILCFAERGYEATTIREIANRAGKLVSLIAYHFGSKERLYQSCFEHMVTLYPRTPVDPRYADLEAIRQDPRHAALALRSVIRGIVQDLHARAGDPLMEASIRMFTAEMNAPRPFLHPFFHDQMCESAAQVRACVASLRPGLQDAEVEFLGQCIFGQCLIQRLAAGVHALVWQPMPPGESPGALADRIADFVLKGLGCQQQT
jgi:AcrR family transcriptional regulator